MPVSWLGPPFLRIPRSVYVLHPSSYFCIHLQCQFAVSFKARNSNTLQRDEVIAMLAKLPGSPHKVDLEDPEIVIVCEAIKVEYLVISRAVLS